MAQSLIDPALFAQLKAQMEGDARIKKELNPLVDELAEHVAYTQGMLSRVHSTPRSEYPALLNQVSPGIKQQVETVGKVAEYASAHPYYKYNFKWTRPVQDAVVTVLLFGWLGAQTEETKPGELGRLLTLDEVGVVFQVPVNLKDRDAFHVTIEEYLLAVVGLVEELSRLATNAVTLGDPALAVRISGCVKDLHAGFQLLNLKNDVLRRRVDSVKYAVKKVEDVIYDLSLRNLLPAADAGATTAAGPGAGAKA